MRQFFIAFLVIAALLVGGSIVASVAYQTGVQVAVNTAAASAPAGTVVTPVVPGYGYGYGPGYGFGWHGGPGIFGILFGIFILFLFIGLLRAAFGAGRGWGGPGGWGYRGGPGGPGGRGGWGNHEHDGDRPWERQARELHDSWHRDNPGESGGGSATDRPSTGTPGA